MLAIQWNIYKGSRQSCIGFWQICSVHICEGFSHLVSENSSKHLQNSVSANKISQLIFTFTENMLRSMFHEIGHLLTAKLCSEGQRKLRATEKKREKSASDPHWRFLFNEDNITTYNNKRHDANKEVDPEVNANKSSICWHLVTGIQTKSII
jgi:hypothetical protein